jgi:hypothetical protein
MASIDAIASRKNYSARSRDISNFIESVGTIFILTTVIFEENYHMSSVMFIFGAMVGNAPSD